MTSRPKKGTAPIPAKESRPKEVDGESLADAEPKGNSLIVSGPLLPEQSARLTECEAVIDGAPDRARAALEKAELSYYIEVGNALLEIRNARLYRQGYNTFERYCRQRWDMSKTTANRYIQAVQVIENLTPIGVIPTSESQIRPLTKLEPEEQCKVWRIATAKNSEPPARQVERIVQKLFHSALEPHKEQLHEAIPADVIQQEGSPPQSESSQATQLSDPSTVLSTLEKPQSSREAKPNLTKVQILFDQAMTAFAHYARIVIFAQELARKGYSALPLEEQTRMMVKSGGR